MLNIEGNFPVGILWGNIRGRVPLTLSPDLTTIQTATSTATTCISLRLNFHLWRAVRWSAVARR